MARKGSAKAKAKTKKGAKTSRKKFQAPLNTKTGAAGDAAAGAKPETEGQPERAFNKSRLTPGSFLKTLIRECAGLAADMGSIGGTIREKIGYAKEKKNLNTSVFAVVRRLDKMEPEKAYDWYYTLLAYVDSSGIKAKIDKVQPLPLDASKEGDDDGDEDEKDDDKQDDKPQEKPSGKPAEKPQEQPQAAANGKANGGHKADAPGGPIHMLDQPNQAPATSARPKFGVVGSGGGTSH